MNILTTCTKSKSNIRNSELSYALKKNNDNPKIQSITLISEDPDVLELTRNLSKIRIVLVKSRVKFSDVVEYCNANFEGSLVGITNADIYFDESLPESIPFGYAFCLTRWKPDIDLDRPDIIPEFSNVPVSFDTYIFRPKIYVQDIDFYMGVPGCDNRFAHQLHASGLLVVNPSKIIRSFHVHASELRTYQEHERLGGEYLNIVGTDSFEFVPENLNNRK